MGVWGGEGAGVIRKTFQKVEDGSQMRKHLTRIKIQDGESESERERKSK